MVIPLKIVNEVADECLEMTLFEDFVLEQVNSGKSIIGLYPPTDPISISEFETWKDKKALN